MFSLPQGEVTFDAEGRTVRVAHHSRRGQSYLAPGFGVGSVTVAGQIRQWERQDIGAYSDEVEVSYRLGGTEQLSMVVRHTFGTGWGVRFAFINTGSEPIVVDAATIRLEPGPGQLGWALTAGAEASYSVHPLDGKGPLLGWGLQLGAIAAATADELVLGRIQLPAGGRYVVQWLWDFYATPADFGRGRHSQVPVPLCLTVGEPFEVLGEDTALLVPDQVGVSLSAGVREVVAVEPGRFPVELRSALGTTAFEMEWAADLSELISERSAVALSGARSGAGVAKLTDAADALVVQRSLADLMMAEPDEARDALELFSSRLLTADVCTPFEIVFLCGEWMRTGDEDLLQLAHQSLLRLDTERPGLGMAATRLSMALLVAGRSVTDILSHLNNLADRIPAPDLLTPLTDRLAGLELLLISHQSSAQLSEPLIDRVDALGAYLGYGLAGSAVDPIDASMLSQLISTWRMLPDGLGADYEHDWAVAPQTLADRYECLARSGIARAAGSEALAWLLIGPQSC